MNIKVPSHEELSRIAEGFYLQPTEEDLDSFRSIIDPALDSYARLDELIEPKLPVKYPRGPGYRPDPQNNSFGAWYWRSEIKGASTGKLAGKTLAIKDNVCVAGIPMMNGTSTLEGYVPDIDATIVTRILDAGGTILGKSVCESLCMSGASHTSDTGPVRNPHNPDRSAGGSSSGSAVLLVSKEVDMAIGGDQGGSIRMPSCWCGIYGLKPTYGLVPYTGIFPIELTIDHTGPMARTSGDVALLLETIAGPDGLDPRQTSGLQCQEYTKALSGDVHDMKIGIVREGFGWDGLSEDDVDETVKAAALKFKKIGATVETLSIPWHRDGIHIWTAIIFEGATTLMVTGNGMGTNWKGHYATGLLDAFARGRRSRAQDLSETTKLLVLLGQYMQDRYHGRYYAKARNLSRLLVSAYNDALAEVDLLVMPTLPMKATPIPGQDESRATYVARALEMVPNTSPFNVTGHPAMNVPCGTSDGLPIGMMLVGKIGDDATVLRAADAFERHFGA